MFTKHISELTFDDITDVVNVRQLREGYHLDYKGEFKNFEKEKNEIAKDLASFANSNGGYLIWGVEKNYEISGVPATINNKPIDEWINQVISYHIDPQLFYPDPKIIPIPDSEIVVVVIHVPESARKPHMVTEKSLYHIRINDSSKPAKHNQVRDMFEFSRNRTMELENYLNKRNLLDEDSQMFGMNINSKSLYSSIPEKTSFRKPTILISFIPKYPQEEKINLSAQDLKDWLRNNSLGFYPMPDMPLFSINRNSELKVNGIVLKQVDMFQTHSYIEILNNGFIEAGYSDLMFSCDKHTKDEYEVFMYLSKLIGHEMLLLGFAKSIYKLAKYYDEVLLQLSFINVLGFGLSNLHYNYRRDFSFGRSHYQNTQHPNFKLYTWFNPMTIDDEGIRNIGKDHSEKICRAFGLDRDYCFYDNEISL